MQDTISSDPLFYLQRLIALPSVTPDDKGCQELVGRWLAPQGFRLRPMPFNKVSNLWATRGSGSPLVIFAGHTDVVPAGAENTWRFPPFACRQDNGYVYGRGVADMKGSIAAFLGATDSIQQSRGTLALLLTSDEEGPAVDGTRKVVEQLKREGVTADAIVIGEPSSQNRIADCIRIGRRGSLSAHVRFTGKGGHVAYPEQVRNPVTLASSAIAGLAAYEWDKGTRDFPPTSLQITSLVADSGAGNVAPTDMRMRCNLRFSPASSVTHIQEVFARQFNNIGLEVHIDWDLSATPFISDDGRLRALAAEAINKHCGYAPVLSTAGGTSDGRFLIDLSDQLIELGPSNATIHQTNERVAIAELLSLRDIYATLFTRLLA